MRADSGCRSQASLSVIPAEGKGTLRVVVSHSVDDADAKAKPVVERDGNTGSFGFTTGEYRYSAVV